MKERLAVEESSQKNKKKNAILLFVKYPERGRVKNRLAIDLDETFVLQLYTYFVEDILTELKKIQAKVIICYFPTSHLTKFQQWLGPSYHYIAQQGADLGERMQHCFTSAFSTGFEKVLVIGSDSPDVPIDFYEKAFSSLDLYDAVIGPCVDGGYYVYGCKNQSFILELFSNIPWSTPLVFEKTMSVLKHHNQKIYELPIWNDVDTYDDLLELAIKNKHNWFKKSKTMKLLNTTIDKHGKNE